jgi:hypothetical protein
MGYSGRAALRRAEHQSIERFIPHKILRKNSDPEYYNKEFKKLKAKKAYNRRKSGQQYREEMRRHSKQLLLAKRNAQETYLGSILKNESKCWTEFYKYEKDVKAIGKIFLRSKMVMDSSLLIQ